MTLAVPGVPVRTRISPLRPTVTGMSARIRRSRSSEAGEGRRPAADVFRGDVDVAVGARRLHEPELGDVARHGRLGDREALGGEGVHDLALAADRPRRDQLADRPLAEALELLRRARVGGGHHAAPDTRLAGGRDAGPERRVGQGAFERVRGGRVGDDRLGAVPAERAERRPDLGHHPAGDDAGLDEVLGLGDGQRVELAAVGVADAVDIGQQDELAGPEAGGDPGRHVVGVDVADDAVRVAGQRRDDRHLAADEDRVEQVAAEADDAAPRARAPGSVRR